MKTLCNGNINLEFEEKGFIKSLKYEDKEYVGGILPIFEIAFRTKDGKQSVVGAFDMELIEIDASSDTFCAKYLLDNLEVNIACKINRQIEWNIKVSGVGESAVEWVDYPQIAYPDDFADKGGTSKILWGFNEGTLIENMEDKEKGLPYIEPNYPSMGIMGIYPAIVETQFVAYYNEKSGMYFASHDSENNLKGINIRSSAGGVKAEFRHYTGGNFGENYEMPYPMVMEFFKGDWHDACEIYRAWFKSLNKSEFVKIKENPKLPDWYGESPVVVTYPVRGTHDTDVMNPNKLFPYINVMPHVKRLEKAFNSKIMVLLMHWEGTAPWAPPIVWPPYGGEAEFKKLVDALHERGDVLGVYNSGLGWTIKSKLVDDYDTSEYFENNNLKEEMCLSPKQLLPHSEICTMQRVGYDMCPTREFTANIVKKQVRYMVDAGIDYIQLMDQNHGGTSYFCYSQKHNHPPMPGKWQVDSVRALLSEINEESGKVLFGCESAAAESYISNLAFSDNRFNLAYIIGKPVPAYSYVFHEYVNNFQGNQVCVDYTIDTDKSPVSFFERIAYSFAAGDMLTAVINENGEIDRNWGKFDKQSPVPNQTHTEKFMRNLNYWRREKGKEYLHFGEMLKPFSVECKDIKIYRRNGTFFTVPEIRTCAFRASNGSVAQFLINYSAEPIEVKFSLESESVMFDNFGNVRDLKSGENTVTVESFSAVMIEKQY